MMGEPKRVCFWWQKDGVLDMEDACDGESTTRELEKNGSEARTSGCLLQSPVGEMEMPVALWMELSLFFLFVFSSLIFFFIHFSFLFPFPYVLSFGHHIQDDLG